jgi:hypothetical protein
VRDLEGSVNEISLLGELAEALADALRWIRKYPITIIVTLVIAGVLVLLVMKTVDQEDECRARGGVPVNSRTDGIVCTKGRLGE